MRHYQVVAVEDDVLVIAPQRPKALATTDLCRVLPTEHLAASMSWTINGQLRPHSRAGVDASGWLWEIQGGEEARRVLVEISGTAWAVLDVAEDTREAMRTEGRSEVDKVLSLDDPPRIIQCGTNGCQPFSDASR